MSTFIQQTAWLGLSCSLVPTGDHHMAWTHDSLACVLQYPLCTTIPKQYFPCKCVVYMRMCTCACVHVCVCVFSVRHLHATVHMCKLEDNLRCQFLPLLYLRQYLLFTTVHARLAGPCASRDAPIFTSQLTVGMLGLQMRAITWFYMSSGHPKPASHLWENTLSMAPSPQPKLYIFNK